ncbi:MAG: 4-phosphopantoate--beta-alanine ligase [Candidatus Hadarchaeota archaeon]
MSWISPKHPRAESLRTRERLVKGFKAGMVAPEGLTAHGRGEAFDYLLGERTTEQARRAIRAAAAALLLAERPVISVNGNVAALVPREIVGLAKLTNAKLEVNLFHGSVAREKKIACWLKKHGAREVLGVDPRFSVKIKEIHSNRRKVDSRGIAGADVVLVPLEDGDRTKALKKLGKQVIAVDLNPMSRTARAASITIVDNIARTMPTLVESVKNLSRCSKACLQKGLENFDNDTNLKKSLELMLNR